MKLHYILLALALSTGSAMAADVNGLSTSQANTNSTAGAAVSGNGVINSYGAAQPHVMWNFGIGGTATNYAAPAAQSYSQASCVNGTSSSTTVAFVAHSSTDLEGGTPCEVLLMGDHMGKLANQFRINASALTTMGAAPSTQPTFIKQRGHYIPAATSPTPVIPQDNVRMADTYTAIADKLDKAHLNIMCRYDAAVYAAMSYEGLCDSLDWDHYTADFKAKTQGRPVVRGDAVADTSDMHVATLSVQ